MLAQFGKRFVVLALVLVTGGHWALLQSIAWVGMAVSYSHDSTLKEALVKTFDGQHPCKLCRAVEEGKKSERKQAPQKPIIKLDFFCLPASMAIKGPAFLPVPTGCAGAISAPVQAPPTPPPRSTLG
jgi:hypothetical protein